MEPPLAAQLGHGTLDYHPVFEAAKKANIKRYFVEQERYDVVPSLEALKIDVDYMKDLRFKQLPHKNLSLWVFPWMNYVQ